MEDKTAEGRSAMVLEGQGRYFFLATPTIMCQ